MLQTLHDTQTASEVLAVHILVRKLLPNDRRHGNLLLARILKWQKVNVAIRIHRALDGCLIRVVARTYFVLKRAIGGHGQHYVFLLK